MMQMDIPAAFAFAQLFAWCGRKTLCRQEPSVSNRYTVIAVSYALGVIGPCALYLYGGWPEWETMYWFDSIYMDRTHFGDRLFALVAPLFLLGLAASAAVGFVLAHRWIRAGQLGRVRFGITIGLALSIGVVLLTPAAPMFVGHLQDHRAYLQEALASASPWDYGVVAVGPWVAGIPFAARPELLQKYNLITCFDPRFFLPLLFDSLVYFGSTAAIAIWFHRARAAALIATAPMPSASRLTGQAQKEVEHEHHPGSLSA